MIRPILGFTLLFFSSLVLCASTVTDPVVWRENFSNYEKESSGRLVPKGWVYKGKPFTSDAVFDLTDCQDTPFANGKILRMVADDASGTYLFAPPKVDLKKHPYIRWCWRVKRFPAGADGRNPKKDDQPIGLYVGTGRFSQDAVAYRWETLTPKGDSGLVSYGSGFVKVKWHALRNQSDSENVWQIETRHIAEDFKNVYGYLPETFAVSVVTNSQNTKSVSEAELAWIEFLSELPQIDSKHQ